MLEFSALFNAAKRTNRTERYKVLAAMYALNGHNVPITANQISALLLLQLGRKGAPGTVSTRLRQYPDLFDPAEKGPPLRWRLTPKGVEMLRKLSGLDLTAGSDSSAEFDFDVAFVCALEHPELTAVIDATGGPVKWREIGDARFAHVYRQTEFQIRENRVLRMVSTTATSMGLTAAAIATTQLIMQFRPRLVIMVGIAAGTRSGDKQFGDVLVADPSVDYNSGKVVQSNGIRDFLPDPYPIGLVPRLRSRLQKYRGIHPVFEGIRKRWKGPVPNAANRLHLGPVGAADQVIDDPMRVIEIQRNWRKLIGVEMETYGVYRACTESPDPKPRFVSFKAVCDFAAEKTDSWQPFAAYMAAQFAAAFLIEDFDALWPK